MSTSWCIKKGYGPALNTSRRLFPGQEQQSLPLHTDRYAGQVSHRNSNYRYVNNPQFVGEHMGLIQGRGAKGAFLITHCTPHHKKG